MNKRKNYLRIGIRKSSKTGKICIIILCALIMAGAVFYIICKERNLKNYKTSLPQTESHVDVETSDAAVRHPEQQETEPESVAAHEPINEAEYQGGGGVELTPEELSQIQEEIQKQKGTLNED